MRAMGTAEAGMAGTQHRAPRVLRAEHRGTEHRAPQAPKNPGTKHRAPSSFCSEHQVPQVTARPCPHREAPPPAAMLLLLFAALTLAAASPGAGLPVGPTGEVPPPPPPAPSALNLTFDPGTWTLTWRCSGDLTVTLCSAIQQGRPRLQRIRPQGCRCQFRPLTLHLGVTLEVVATVAAGSVPVHERLDYVAPGPPGSEASNVSCEIHEAAAMMCTWGAGPAAPPDARYFLVLRNATGHLLPGCPGGPAPSGCRLDDLAGLPRLLHVTVAGSSRSGGALRAYDVVLNTKAIERLSPPRELSGRCNASHCAVTWAPPRTWAAMGPADFRYELDLRRADADPDATVTVASRPENCFVFPSPEPRGGHGVRARAGDVRSERWSAWSPRVSFGAAHPAVSRLPVCLTAAAGTLVCALALALAWRFSGHRPLLPRVPRIRDKVSDDARINPETLRKDLVLPDGKAA